MNRREFLTRGGTLAVASSVLQAPVYARASRTSKSEDSFQWIEATVPRLQDAMRNRQLTSTTLVRAYLERIDKLDRRGPSLRSVIELNPDAIPIARELDRERKHQGPRGPLHGIPVLIKDNIATADKMRTTAGSLALVTAPTPREAFLVERLREAGAIILGKTNLSEWANFRSNQSTSGWSGRGGLTRNPYVLDRNTSGSSSGSAAAVCANLCSVAVGTETDGSIISPSSYCGIVGIKPTVGLISRSGIIPISATQDTAGPMTRSVTDAAILLGALTGSDPSDAATTVRERKERVDYAQYLDRDGLRGARIGVARKFFPSRSSPSNKVLDSALLALKKAGAELIDPIEVKSFENLGDAEYQVLLYEFKDGINKYLSELGKDSPVRSLADLIQFNEFHRDQELPYFGQETFIAAQKKGPLSDSAYLEALQKCRRLSREEGIDAVMEEHRLDAIIGPSGGPAHRTDLIYGDRDTGGSSSPAAVAGYPNITVPAGFVRGLPVGLSFFGPAFSEPVLLKLAYAFEQATLVRTAPRFLASLEMDESPSE